MRRRELLIGLGAAAAAPGDAGAQPSPWRVGFLHPGQSGAVEMRIGRFEEGLRPSTEDLKDAFLTHRDETAGHVERLEQVFDILGKKASRKTCEAIKGIIEEGQEIMENFQDSDALDAGLIAAGQAIEHYEMSRYGTLRTCPAVREFSC